MGIWKNRESFLHSFTFPSLYQAPKVYMESEQCFPEDYFHLITQQIHFNHPPFLTYYTRSIYLLTSQAGLSIRLDLLWGKTKV